jgi:hypothetical protein
MLGVQALYYLGHSGIFILFIFQIGPFVFSQPHLKPPSSYLKVVDIVSGNNTGVAW